MTAPSQPSKLPDSPAGQSLGAAPCSANGIRPLYDSRDFSEYCADQKRKGLRRSLWRTLPQMWQEELAFRKEFEDAAGEQGLLVPHERTNSNSAHPEDVQRPNAAGEPQTPDRKL